jgi:hypothetical protein
LGKLKIPVGQVQNYENNSFDGQARIESFSLKWLGEFRAVGELTFDDVDSACLAVRERC